MPVDKPNRKLFKPIIPKSIDNHYLFGYMYHKHHQLEDARWTPEELTHQYFLMKNCLSKNMRYSKLKECHEKEKRNKDLHILRQEICDGRTRLKNAAAGDLTKIRRILFQRKDLQRKYKSMSIPAIMESCDQESFIRRKENDRLKYQLQITTNKLKDLLIKQSLLEDRITYRTASHLNTEKDSKTYRRNIDNSRTRIRAYQFITQAYNNILNILTGDDYYMESIINSVYSDILEQKNFIQQVVLLGLPVIKNNKNLIIQYNIMEYEARRDIKENAHFTMKIKKKLQETQRDFISAVRSYNPTLPNSYLRTTPSMVELETEMSDIRQLITEMKVVTMSPKSHNIEEKMTSVVKNTDYFKKKIKRNNRQEAILKDQYDQANVQLSYTKYNYQPEDKERSLIVKHVKEKIEYNKKLQRETDLEIVDIGNMLQLLNFSLDNIVCVLWHVGRSFDQGRKEYVNPDLMLPLLKFDFFTTSTAIPPTPYDRKTKKLLSLAKDRITALMKNPLTKIPHAENEFASFNKQYTAEYLQTLETEEHTPKVTDDSTDSLFTTESYDANILTPKMIHQISAKIVEINKKKIL